MASNTIISIIYTLFVVTIISISFGFAFGTSYNLDGTETLELVEGGYLDKSADCYGNGTVVIGNTDLCVIGNLFSPDGNKINAWNLKTGTYYTLYKERFLFIPRYYLICGN